MQMLFPAAGKWRIFFIPQKGDHVASMRLPNGNEQGFILGTYYSESNMPVDGAEGVYQIISADGENRIRLNADGTMEIEFKDSINIKSPNIAIETGNMSIKAESFNLDGSMNITGNISNDGDMTTGGKHTDGVGEHVPPMA
jgi:phage baseplate assembly protein V